MKRHKDHKNPCEICGRKINIQWVAADLEYAYLCFKCWKKYPEDTCL